MKNSAWYKDAQDLDVQLHCYLKDGDGAACYLHIQSKQIFEPIEGLRSRQLEQRDELNKVVDAVLDHEAVKKPKGLGVIFYLADDFSLAGLGPEHQNPIELDNLRSMMIEDPMEVLDDKTVSTETHAWRIFPYPGAPAGDEFATAVAVSKHRYRTLEILREIGDERNLPIRTRAVSAPLCALGLLPWCTKNSKSGTIALFNYHTFTLMGFFNGRCDLMMLRCMPHPSGAHQPMNIGPALMATASAFELEAPEIKVFSMVGHDAATLESALQMAMPESEIIQVDGAELLHENGLPKDLPLECLVTTEELDVESHPLSENETFSTLRDESWHLQDFLSADQNEVEMYPDEGDMKLLKLGKRFKKFAVIALLMILGYTCYSVSTKIKSDAWTHKEQNIEGETIQLTAELKQFERWDNLLKDRSKAWASLELISKLVPEDRSVVLKDVKHSVAQRRGEADDAIGFAKEWTINGWASDQGIEFLEYYSTRDGVKKLFDEVANDTGNSVYQTGLSSRDITVSLKQRLNPTFNSINPEQLGDTYRKIFTMVITQSVSSEDDMALAAVKE